MHYTQAHYAVVSHPTDLHGHQTGTTSKCSWSIENPRGLQILTPVEVHSCLSHSGTRFESLTSITSHSGTGFESGGGVHIPSVSSHISRSAVCSGPRSRSCRLPPNRVSPFLVLFPSKTCTRFQNMSAGSSHQIYNHIFLMQAVSLYYCYMSCAGTLDPRM
jgi:hypothetical protein